MRGQDVRRVRGGGLEKQKKNAFSSNQHIEQSGFLFFRFWDRKDFHQTIVEEQNVQIATENFSKQKLRQPSVHT